MNNLLQLRQTIRQSINQRLIDALSKNKVPWFRAWNNHPNAGFPTNVISKKRYSGINSLLLQLTATERGYHSKYWGTSKQWETLGGTVKLGETGTSVSFYKTLFNAHQVEGLDEYCVNVSFNSPNVVDLDFAEVNHLICIVNISIIYGGSRAYYTRPIGNWPNHTAGDEIVMPPLNHFADPIEYYITVLHEIAHYVEVRLDWVGTTAEGELIAEIVACQLGAECGITNNDWKNHNKYLELWLTSMKTDVNWIFKATSQASRVVNYVLERRSFFKFTNS